MQRLKRYSDWLFRDLTTRRGNYVIAEVPNLPLLAFMASLIISVLVSTNYLQNLFLVIACAALLLWGVLEAHSGRSRFRKLLGWLGILAVAGAVLFTLGL